MAIKFVHAFIDYDPPKIIEFIVGALDFTWTIRELPDGLKSATHECCQKSRLHGGQISRQKYQLSRSGQEALFFIGSAWVAPLLFLGLRQLFGVLAYCLFNQ